MTADLVATKGRTRRAKRRHDRACEALRQLVQKELARRSRAPYRGGVTLNLTLVGYPGATRDRSVKGLLDALAGCLYADDAQISLLEVTALGDGRAGEGEAIVRASSESEYRRRFDAVRRALDARDWERWPDEDASELPNPWAWPDDVQGWDRLEETRENLEWARTTDVLEGHDREAIVRADEMIYRQHLRARLLDVPLGAADCPGPAPPEVLEEPLTVRGQPIERLHPTACWLHAPAPGLDGSFSSAVADAASANRERWQELAVLREERIALDIALDAGAGAEFDLDNLARRIVGEFAKTFDWLTGEPRAYRIYRREAQEPGVLVRIRSFDALRALEQATQGYMLGLDFRPARRNGVFD